MKRLLVALVLFVALCVPVLADGPVAWIDWGPKAERHGDYVSVPGLAGRMHTSGEFDYVLVRFLSEGEDPGAGPGFFTVRIEVRHGKRLYHWQQRIYVRGEGQCPQ